jgi:hypothetical protein
MRSDDVRVLCVTCWINTKYGGNYPAAHTGIGPNCPRKRKEPRKTP